MQPSLDCRFANAKNLCRLGDIKVLHVAKNKDLAVNVWQLGQCFGDCFPHFFLFNCITR
jgi:hypothetical protein